MLVEMEEMSLLNGGLESYVISSTKVIVFVCGSGIEHDVGGSMFESVPSGDTIIFMKV
jgi:hypothetical protein